MKNPRRCNCCGVFVRKTKQSTSFQLLSVTSNFLIHMCGYSLQLHIQLFCTKNTFIKSYNIFDVLSGYFEMFCEKSYV